MILLVSIHILMLFIQEVELHGYASGGKSFLNRDAAVTFLRTQRDVCNTNEGNGCQFEGHCEGHKKECTRETDRETYCSATPCKSGLTCYLLIPCPCHFTTDCSNDHCKSLPCRNGGTCTLTSNYFTCSCRPGYAGRTCEIDINECHSAPCQNGGQCKDLINSYSCTCRPGFLGKNCQIDINECQSDPCQNQATCINEINRYTCRCKPGYTGTNCQTEINECQSNPCQNGGSCHDLINMYACACVPGYTGTNCETEINECQSNPCLNGGQCVDLLNKYNCLCVPGYRGINCQIDINECQSTPCQNGGRCNDLINMYTCTCIPGYTGTNCEAETNECLSNPCQNGGSCDDLFNRYRCNCIPGYTGTNCQTDIDECSSSPCQNQNTCNNLINEYTCDCSARYNGTNCEKDCRPGPADILFVIDTSYSTKVVFNKTLNFIDKFLTQFPVGPDDFQMAAITFANNASLAFDFDDYTDNSSLWTAFHSISPSSLGSHTDKALELARNVLLDRSRGWRQNVAKYIILLYDGLSTNRRQTLVSRQRIVYGLKSVSLFTVGIGEQVDKTELSGVASSYRHVYSSLNNDALNTILRETSHFDCDDCIENSETDLLLMLDTSNSQSITELQDLKTLAEVLINYFDINTNKNIQISIAGFAENINAFSPFSKTSNNNDLKLLIQKMAPVSEKSNLAMTLHDPRLASFASNNSANGKRKLVVIFSNAYWINHDSAKDEANKLKSQGVTLINIGVGFDADLDKLIDIASDPYYVYLILDHQTEHLKVLASEAMPTACNKDIFQIRV